MARGKWWTSNEDDLLKALIEDYPEENSAWIARKAKRYGVFPYRTADAIAARVSKLRYIDNSETDEEDDDDRSEQIAILEGEIRKLKMDRDAFADALFDTLSPFPQGTGVKVDYKALKEVLRTYEPERWIANLEEIEEIQYEKKKENKQ